MRTRISGLLTLTFLVLFAHSTLAATNTETLAKWAVSAKPSESAPAIAELRSMGPAGLDVLLENYAAEIKHHVENPLAADTPEWRRLTASLDAVSQQKHSHLSKLYWYTDMKAATAAAQASGKPILSLRLLGKLDQELSCANSRFFRSILYSNEHVSRVLRERFVLHWQTVREVPRITIDFGDGRKIERTITGNSIHYVLDSDGKAIEAFPGLYGPQPFLDGLSRSLELTQQLKGRPNQEREMILSNYHRRRLNALAVSWVDDTRSIGGQIPEGMRITKDEQGNAFVAMPVAMTKAMTEISVLRSMMAAPESLGRITDEVAWRKIAALHSGAGSLDAASLGLIKRQTQRLFAKDKSPLSPEVRQRNLIEKLQASIALDTVRNEYLFHTHLHAWLTMPRNRADVDSLNEKVYSELFLMPKSDRWFGLLLAETYSGLDDAGASW